MTLTQLKELIAAPGTYTFIQSLLIGTVFFLMVAGLHVVIWFMFMSTLQEIGYPKTKQKALSKQFKAYSWRGKMSLIPLVKDARNKSCALWFYWSLSFINLLLGLVSVVCWIGTVVSRGAGWALTGLLVFPTSYFFISTALRFIPDLIFMPSERRRYFRK